MALDIVVGRRVGQPPIAGEAAIMYDTMTMCAFGPVVTGPLPGDAQAQLEGFIEWCLEDPRACPGDRLEELWTEYKRAKT